MPERPVCGGSCSACHTCPDLIVSEHDAELYMRGVEDGKAIARTEQEVERQAIAAHWEHS